MGCNENVVKNMAYEITRNCQAHFVTVDPDFVIYLIDLLLLNPKYGKLFKSTINRNNLAYFVDECGALIMSGGTSLNTLRIQFIMQTNYDKMHYLIDKHQNSIRKCLKPLVNEIMEVDPDPEDEAAFKKLFRKISIYIILCSGLGNPALINTLKEGMVALESVFSMDDLKMFVALPAKEKYEQLETLLQIVSGVRLFNRDCKKGGENIPDLPFNLVDASKACVSTLSNCLITVMKSVNSLTTAIQDCVAIEEETGNVQVKIKENSNLTVEDYNKVFQHLAFKRQYEVFIRRLLHDVEYMSDKATDYVEKIKAVLEELHAAVKYKDAVPVVNVFPLFIKLWQVWQAMQNLMYLVSTVNRLMGILNNIQDHIKVPFEVLENLLSGMKVVSDNDRMGYHLSLEDRMVLTCITHYVSYNAIASVGEKCVQFLGFCVICLSLGALVPSLLKLGVIKEKDRYYGFCSVKMAVKFSANPQRYVNEALDYARNHPHLINLLNIQSDVYALKDVEGLVSIVLPKVKIFDREVQTEVHPIDEYHEKNYSWNLWEWKRRACQWASIVNCQTHSTQTNYSHLRSEIHAQTVEFRDVSLQTKRECGTNTAAENYYLWGLRGVLGMGQHSMNMKLEHSPERMTAQEMTACARCTKCANSNVQELKPSYSDMSGRLPFYQSNRSDSPQKKSFIRRCSTVD